MTITIGAYELVKGKIISFNQEKGYGFVRLCIDDNFTWDFFLHWGDGASIVYDGFDLAFDYLYENSSFPKKGDDILFAVGKGSKGRPKANPWCFESSYLSAKKELERDWEEPEEDNWEEDSLCEVKLPDGRTGVQVSDYHESNLGGDVGSLIVYE
jgi:hypothetical protein